MNTPLQGLSAKTADYFYKRESDDRWFRKDDSPAWVEDMTHEAHMDTLPNNYSYEFIVSALFAFTDYENPDTAIIEAEENPYNWHLIDWMGSNLHRIGYAEDYAEVNHGPVMESIRGGQRAEMRDVYYVVLKHLNQQLDDDD
tara:strand:+ start:848 stop:1273 length:426 start_codon:yes stop_codon:yes gene_type:complete